MVVAEARGDGTEAQQAEAEAGRGAAEVQAAVQQRCRQRCR